jgi:two-component system response regulator AtoC
MSKGKILVIDDEKLITDSLQKILTNWGYEVVCHDSAHTILTLLAQIRPNILILDIYIGDRHGVEMMKLIRREGWQVPIILMTAYADVSLAVQAMKDGASDFLVKPIDLEHLSLLLAKTLEHARLQKKIDLLQQQIEESHSSSGIIARSKEMVGILDIARKLATSGTTTVLLEGESGTGKELVARFICEQSARVNEPFIKINCGAIPKDLAESEIFGYEKGAFTGANDRMKLGRFELAHGGTILLDEIGELTPDLQVKLLRVLEEQRFFRLGGTKEILVDVRVLAATNRDLAREVEAGRFREDLFYRLNVASLKIPPLRERKDDIGVMVQAFLEEYCRKFNKIVPKISPEVLQLLESHRWKGNVRELRNAIERVVLLNDADILRAENFAFLNLPSMPPAPAPAKIESLANHYVLEVPDKGVPINQVMKDLILKTLAITNGNQVQAAKVLGLSRSKLRYRISQLGIEGERGYKSVDAQLPQTGNSISGRDLTPAERNNY